MGASNAKLLQKMFDRFMNRRVELSNDKEISTTLTAPGTIRTAVGRNILSKISRKTCVKKLINKFGHLKHCAVQQEASAIS